MGTITLMRVIVDTNVLLSALISDQGPPEQIYRARRAARFQLVTSDMQLDEVRRASRYPKLKTILQPHRVGAMINNLQRALVLTKLPPLPERIAVDDPHDAFLAAAALLSSADYLVTGDRRAGLLRLGHIGRTRILTPAQFCEAAL